MGHSGKDLQRYNRLTLDQIFEEYKKSIPFLTIERINMVSPATVRALIMCSVSLVPVSIRGSLSEGHFDRTTL